MKKFILFLIIMFLADISYASTEISTAGTNLGIGTTSVANALSIANTVVIGGSAYTSKNAPTNSLIVQGNIGIGTIVPQATLEVDGNIYQPTGVFRNRLGACVSDSATPTASPGDGNLTVEGEVTFGVADCSQGSNKLNVSGNEVIGQTYYSMGGINDPNGLSVEGNVGIGTINGFGKLVIFGGNVGIGTNIPTQSLDINGTVRALSSIFLGTASSSFTTNVGIGSSNPTQLLDVIGTVKATSFIYTGGTPMTECLHRDSSGVITGTGSDCGAGGGGSPGGTGTEIQFRGGASTFSAVTGSGSVGGNIGIGSTIPTQKIDVAGTVKATSFVGDGSLLTGISGSISGLTTGKLPKAGSSTTIVDSVISELSSNIGIGSVAPSKTLDVNGTIRINSSVSTTVPSLMTDIGGTNGIGVGQSGAVSIITNSLQRFQVKNDGNVGIATSDPTARFYVQTGSGLPFIISGTTGTTTTSGNVVFTGSITTSGISDFPIGNSGGAGTSVTVTGGQGTDSSINLKSTGVGVSAATDAIKMFTGNNSERLRITNAGNVGIGSITPGQTLDVTGTVRISQQLIVSGIGSDAGKTDATICEDTTVHQFYSGSGTLGICLGTSTRDAKQNITPINEGLTEIMSLKPISFNYKPGWGYDAKKSYYGFLAEDVDPILPRLVGRNNKGKIRNADYVGMIPVMVKAIQELQAEINYLKNRSK